MRSRTAKPTILVWIALSLPIQSACQMRSSRSSDFAALTTPICYQTTAMDRHEPATSFVGKAKSKMKDTATFIRTGMLLAGGLVAWMWLSDDDESLFEQQEREEVERGWKRFWRDHPNVNPAMTAAFKDDYE